MIVVTNMCPGKGMTYDENILAQGSLTYVGITKNASSEIAKCKRCSRTLSEDGKMQYALMAKGIAQLWYSLCVTFAGSDLENIDKQHDLFLDRVGEIAE